MGHSARGRQQNQTLSRGVPIETTPRSIVDEGAVIVESIVTAKRKFEPVLAIAAAMTGEALVSGSAELRVTETDAAGVVVDMTPTPLPLADTAGVYTTWALVTTVPPRAGRNTYRVEARVAASGDSAALRFASMALAVSG